ncbi:MAG: glycosyltransferase family 4 protein [Myxococcota bacterium]|nr:glycosyltransferase family 4 protein [Myxococcota bacterium]
MDRPLEGGAPASAAGGDRQPLICMLLQHHYDNDARVKREARTLQEEQYRIHLITLCDEGAVPGIRSDGSTRVETLRVRSRGLPRTPFFWLVKYLEFVVRAAWRAARLRPDVYHAHDLPMVVPAWLASFLHPAPIVYDAHELYPEMTQPHRFMGPAWRVVDRWAVHRVAAIIAVNRSRADIMVADYSAPEPVIIPNLPVWIPMAELPDRHESPLRRKVHEQLGRIIPPILLYQGLLGPSRCLDQVVEALAQGKTDVVLALLGHHGAYVDHLLEKAVSLGIEDRVLYFGSIDSDELKQWTVGADAGLVIYARTPLNNYLCAPNKLFEYCMAGVPVIGCDYPEVRRPLETSAAGELFEPESPTSIAAAVDRLLGDPERLEEARQAALELREEHHWGRARDALLALYRDVFAKSD